MDSNTPIADAALPAAERHLPKKRVQCLLAVYLCGLFLLVACRQVKNINPNTVDHIELIQVDHPYIGSSLDSIELDNKLVGDFLADFADRKEEITKFFSCYVIKIYLKNGQLICYRTNGNLFEKFKDDVTTATYFKLNKELNLITKYWGIPAEKLCKSRQMNPDNIRGTWYLNKWTMYHTLVFNDKTVFIDNHIDSVFTINYSLANDTLILRDNDSTITYKNELIALTKDTLIIKSFGGNSDTLRYSRTKRPWKN